ncbi:uncharacterized protein LOC6727990 [Drosophila simulans]|uniref:GD20363 n=1 Tax=Drosophila simulans TaxID=7240 RepID=B4QYK0_DROSI|nr:uncharacterized protein LOC6727990 [Drosophila simulans]EDX12845.1 GD20363 [Drosophila simulans]KMZ03419.1 uncharacterized protein Dsimw501_GD20363 [Drosophila simulans]
MMTTDFAGSQFVSSNPNASCSASRWLTEEVFKLIEIVQRDEAIYNPRHKYYFCRPYVENFWREVDLKLEKNPGASLAKWTNLRISFRREYTNYLEEKVPPCWSYFDRMFFLHPYLRKKHQQPKSLDTQVQDALAHLSNLSSRMQRERSVTIPGSSSIGGQPTPSAHQSPPAQQMDNYLDYFDEAEHNNSELDDIMEEEQQRNSRYHSQLDGNDIKSECEEPVDEYEQEAHEPEEDEQDDQDPHKMAPTSSSSSAEAQRRYANQHSHASRMLSGRLQMRTYHDEMRGAIRPRSQELQAPTAAVAGVNYSAQPTAHPNISFVRPTFSKPVDLVSTTTHAGGGGGGGVPGTAGLSEPELPTPSTAAVATPMAPSSSVSASSSSSYLSQRHGHNHMHGGHPQVPPSTLPLRLEANNPSGGSVSNGGAELCDCKTDPDAMFLMSLLPDIQKLNGRDRGKIKIAFQNILQDYLYPD